MKDLEIKVFEKPIKDKDSEYGVMFSIGTQRFKLDYYGNREEAEWMKGMLVGAIDSLLSQQMKEVLGKIESYIKENEKLNYHNRIIAGEEIKSLIN